MSHRVPVLRCFALIVMTAIAPLAAQDSTTRGGRFCLRARPKPACDGFALTTIGAYVVFGSNNPSHRSVRGVVDYGIMVNVNARSAFGGSVFASLDQDGPALGPALRYRRWLTPKASLDVAVGTPLVATGSLRTGGVFGQVRWSPNHWFSLAARPEVVRLDVCHATCAVESRGRFSVGTEVGAAPGLVLTGVGTAGVLAFLLIWLSAGSSL